MADTIATYIGNGTQTDFSVPFDYLKKSFVRVYLDETTLLTGGDYGDTSVDYYFLDNTTVRLKTPPAEGVEVTIRRYTSATERIVSFEDASILKATDLDTSQLQSFHIAEEARDSVNDAMLKDSEGNWDAKGNRITNVGDPVEGSDAINLDWYNKDAGKVQENANKTEQWRNEAEGFRNESETFRDEAEESSDLAKDWAIKMDGKVVEDTVEVDYSAKYWATSIKEYGEASLVVADNIEDVNTVADNIDSVTIVGGDLEGTIREPFVDMGRVGTGGTDGDVEVTGGNIKKVADNITDVNTVADFIDSGEKDAVLATSSITEANKQAAQLAETNAKISETNAKTSETNAKTSETNAKAHEDLAKDWAIKTDGLVNNEDYSSKYYAQQAKSEADKITATSDEINQAVTEGLKDISTSTTQGVSQVTSTYEQGVTNLEDATQQHLTEINQVGTANVSNVNQAGTTQVGLVEQEGTDQVALVTAEGTKQVQRVEDAGDAQVELVNTSGTTQTKAVNDAGTTQVGLVTAEGTKQVGLVTTAGTTQVDLVETASEEAIASITSEGATQVGLVQTAGTSATEAISTAKDSAVSSVTSTGTTQVEAVNTASSTAQSTINNLVSTATTNINASVQKAQDWAEKTDGEVEDGAYSAKYWANQATGGQLNSDWNETDPNSKGYIKNKPDLSVYALKTEISTIYRYMGSVDTYDQLPIASQVKGDSYNVAQKDDAHGIKAGDNVVWNGTGWDNLSGTVDLSAYLTKSEASNTYATKTEVTSGLSGKLDTATYNVDKATFETTAHAGETYATKSELTSGLAGKSNTNHTHTVSNITDYTTQTQSMIDTSIASKADQASLELVVGTVNSMNTELKGKAPLSHTHTASQVTDFTAQVQSLINSSRITDYGRVGS